MPTLSDKISGVYEKVNELGTMLSHLRIDNQQLGLENRTLKREVSDLQDRIAELDKKLNVNVKLQSEHQMAQGKNNKEMRREIDKYIHKIDECIDLLNKN